MDPSEYIARRANLDDLPGLKKLWEYTHLQVLDLERRLTEFQLVSTSTGNLIGVIGLQINGKHGRLHSEAFTHPEEAADARPILWERLQNLARNHGLTRLWTQETSPFWLHAGFAEPDPGVLKQLPTAFGDRHGHWSTLSLREEHFQAISIEKEFELFQQTQRANTEQVLDQARKLKTFAYLFALIVAAITLAGLTFIFFKASRPAPTPDIENRSD